MIEIQQVFQVLKANDFVRVHTHVNDNFDIVAHHFKHKEDDSAWWEGYSLLFSAYSLDVFKDRTRYYFTSYNTIAELFEAIAERSSLRLEYRDFQ